MRHAIALGVAGVALAAVPATATAATPWVGLQPVTTNTPSAGLTPTPAQPPVPGFAVNASGRAAAAWLSVDGAIVASRRAPDGAWTAPQTVSPAGKGGGLAKGLDLVIDAAGDATVAWSSDAGGSGEVLAATSVAGAPFGPAVSVKTAVKPSVIDLAMNDAGETAIAFDTGATDGQVYASTAPTAGGAWAPPVAVSDGSSSHGGYAPSVDINDSGRAIVVWTDTTGGNANKLLGTVRQAGGDWPVGGSGPFGFATVEASATARSARAAIDDAGAVSVLFRDGQSVRMGSRTATSPTFTVSELVASGCSNSVDYVSAVALAGDGARTIAYACGGALKVVERAAGAGFANANATAQTLTTLTAAPRLALSVNAGGQAALLVGLTSASVYRRSAPATPFAGAEPLVEPARDLLAEGIGLSTAGDGVALVGSLQAAPGGLANTIDQRAAILDVTTPTAAVDGPDAARVGDVLSFTASVSDAFGGLVGTPAWTATDGSSGSGTSFVHTFSGPGQYTVTVTQTDLAGHVATATKVVTVAERVIAGGGAPAPTPGPGGGGASPGPAPGLGGPSAPGPGATPAPPAAPQISAVAFASTAFRVLAPRKGKKPSGGTTLAVTLTAPAAVQGKVELKGAGVTKTVGGKATCAAPPKKKVKGQKACVRLTLKGTLQFGTLPAGTSPAIPFTGTLGRTKLKPGKYQLTVSIPGTSSAGRTADFTIRK